MFQEDIESINAIYGFVGFCFIVGGMFVGAFWEYCNKPKEAIKPKEKPKEFKKIVLEKHVSFEDGFKDVFGCPYYYIYTEVFCEDDLKYFRGVDNCKLNDEMRKGWGTANIKIK